MSQAVCETFETLVLQSPISEDSASFINENKTIFCKCILCVFMYVYTLVCVMYCISLYPVHVIMTIYLMCLLA